ncbi:MAG TPA: ferritin family protein [Planctomycetes bacterium]|nr:ferritin family protein [Planctomycetota bacterium]
MSVTFNAFEIFEIAEKIERNGAKFYRRAAELFDDSRTRNMFLQLADWETTHEQVFADMRKELSAQGPELRTFEPENSVVFDAQSMAGLAVFGNMMDPSEELTGKESITDVLKSAIEKEEDSIVFYTGLEAFIPASADKDRIGDIIREEMHHVRILNESLEWR